MNLQEKVDQAYQEGRDAFYDGKKKPEDNPYNPYNNKDENYLWLAWNEGYYNAQHE
jgi:hypothetical protein